MADDLVERLRKLADDMERHATEDWDEHEDVRSAADRITALQAQNRKLVEALRPFAAFAEAGSFDKLPDDLAMTQGSRFAHRQVTAGDFKCARAAIAEAEKGER